MRKNAYHSSYYLKNNRLRDDRSPGSADKKTFVKLARNYRSFDEAKEGMLC
jgi:hypothetical protein